MMKFLMLTFYCFAFNNVFSQISIINAKEKEYPKPIGYDSTYNSGSYERILRLTGQTIFFIPHSNKYKGKANKYSENFFSRNPIKVKDPQKPPAVENVHWSKSLNKAFAENMTKRYPDVDVFTYKPDHIKVNYNMEYRTPLDSVEGKYFKIRGITEHLRLGSKIYSDGIYFNLISKANPDDSLHWKISFYDAKSYKNHDYLSLSGPFLIQAYYEKIKRQFENKNFYLNQSIPNIWDVKSGKIITAVKADSIWVCNSVSLIETQQCEYLKLCLILKNGDKTIAVSPDNEASSFSDALEVLQLDKFDTEDQFLQKKMVAEEIEKHKKELAIKIEDEHKRLLAEEAKFESDMVTKFGAKIGKLISDHKVIIGMNKDMCKLSWGEPNDINRTIFKTYTHEQWVYSMSTYLYFDNGILIAIQD